MFKTVLDLGSGITVFKPEAAARLTGQGASIPSGTVAAMSRGPVGRPFRVTSANFEKMCGKPLSMREGTVAEGLRHIEDALQGSSYVSAVRVVPSTAKVPVIAFTIDDAATGSSLPVLSAVSFGSEPTTQGVDDWLTLWPVNGDPSVGVTAAVAVDLDNANRFTLTITDGENVTEIKASTAIDDVDDRGLSLYLPSVLEDGGYEYACIIRDDFDTAKIGDLSATFTDGTNGNYSDITAAEFKAGWTLLGATDPTWKAGFAAGNYDASVLKEAYSVCESRMAEFRFDAEPSKSEMDAVSWVKTDGPKGYLARAYHYPYLANDPHYGGKAAWGVSGVQTANKAKCVALPTGHASVAGWMFVPAGETRGAIGRGGVKPIHFANFASSSDYYNNRVNPVVQGMYVDDCLSTAPVENDLKLEQTGAVLAAMAYDFSVALKSLKFSPSGATLEGLEALSEELVSRYYDSGSLVDPTTMEVPYHIEITQPESDYWHVSITLKVTGVARRFGIKFKQAK